MCIKRGLIQCWKCYMRTNIPNDYALLNFLPRYISQTFQNFTFIFTINIAVTYVSKFKNNLVAIKNVCFCNSCWNTFHFCNISIYLWTFNYVLSRIILNFTFSFPVDISVTLFNEFDNKSVLKNNYFCIWASFQCTSVEHLL